MDPQLRRAWTEIVTAGDYERHMRSIGQAQAAAELTTWLIGAAGLSGGDAVTVAGAGTGQMFDFLESAVFRPYRLTFTDLNPMYLECLRERLAACGLAAEVAVDDIEQTRLGPDAALLMCTLLLEHIDWRRGVEALVSLRPRACGIVMQENPPEFASAVTPGRELPPSLAEAMKTAHATLVPRAELVETMAARGYACRAVETREVADGKRLVALLFAPAT